MKNLVFGTVGAIVVLGMGSCTYINVYGAGPNYSNGFRVGEIQKGSYKGVIFKSFEGELVQSGLRTGLAKQVNPSTAGSMNIWAFSATDPSVMKQLAESGGAQVRLTYNQWYISPMAQDTSYTVTKVEPVR